MTTPPLRFPEFVDPWREATAGDAFSNSKAKGEAGLPIWSVTLDRGMVPRDSLDRHLESDAADELNLRAQPGDLVYNMMRMWQGAVGQATEECMVSPAYVVLSPKEGISSTFFDYWFNAPHMMHRLRAYSHGLTKDRLRLYYGDFAKIPLSIPREKEQVKVAEFLETITFKMQLLDRERQVTEKFRDGVIDRIFSRKVRFSDGERANFPAWKDKKLGEIASLSKGMGIPKSDIDTDGQYPCIHYGDLFTVYGPVIDKVVSRTNSKEGKFGKKGDVLMPASDVTPTGLCTASALMEDGVKLGGDINIIRPREEVHSPWLSYAIAYNRKQILRIITGTTVKHLYGRDLSKISLEVPCYEEQIKIAQPIQEVDARAAAIASEIRGLEQFKRGLLQELFV